MRTCPRGLYVSLFHNHARTLYSFLVLVSFFWSLLVIILSNSGLWERRTLVLFLSFFFFSKVAYSSDAGFQVISITLLASVEGRVRYRDSREMFQIFFFITGVLDWVGWEEWKGVKKKASVRPACTVQSIIHAQVLGSSSLFS